MNMTKYRYNHKETIRNFYKQDTIKNTIQSMPTRVVKKRRKWTRVLLC